MRRENMTIRKLQIERLSVSSSKPFDAIVATLKASVGRLDLVEFSKASKSASTFSELEKVIRRDMGRKGLMLFLELDHGAVLRKETGLDKPKMVRLLIGNPLVIKEMAKHALKVAQDLDAKIEALLASAADDETGNSKAES